MKQLLVYIFIFCVFSQENIFSQDTISLQSVEGITEAFRGALDGKKGEKRDTTIFRNLFLPSATIYQISHLEHASKDIFPISLDEIIHASGSIVENTEVVSKTTGLTFHELGKQAIAIQTVQTTNVTSAIETRGISCYNLVYIKDRWWIASWTGYTSQDDFEIPDEFLFPSERKN